MITRALTTIVMTMAATRVASTRPPHVHEEAVAWERERLGKRRERGDARNLNAGRNARECEYPSDKVHKRKYSAHKVSHTRTGFSARSAPLKVSPRVRTAIEEGTANTLTPAAAFALTLAASSACVEANMARGAVKNMEANVRT